MIFDQLSEAKHELLVFGCDPVPAYRGIIAIHSTKPGPAVGGTRFWHYESEAAAIADALRLARAMTYKSALAGLPFGGGKAVIIGDARTTDRERLYRAHGRLIETLGGRFITGEDVGTSTADLEYVRLETKHVAVGPAMRIGDPSPWTARGVLRGMQAAARHRWGTDELAGRTVMLQGCGNVGFQLAKELSQLGAKLLVADPDVAKTQRAVVAFGATAIAPADVFGAQADIFAPCALGEILNAQTIPQLRVGIIAGAANNQLSGEQDGETLRQRGILYAPDYVINAGGIISGGVDLAGWDIAGGRQKVEDIYQTTLTVLALAEAQGIAPQRAADQLAERRL
ncbi:MAG: Leu/Phe/Val dehydrogenase [Blastocatellia bacterium]